MNNNLLSRITFNPLQSGGNPCIRGVRIRVADVLSLLATGLNTEEVIKEIPDLTFDDINACLLYAATRIDHPIIRAA